MRGRLSRTRSHRHITPLHPGRQRRHSYQSRAIALGHLRPNCALSAEGAIHHTFTIPDGIWRQRRPSTGSDRRKRLTFLTISALSAVRLHRDATPPRIPFNPQAPECRGQCGVGTWNPNTPDHAPDRHCPWAGQRSPFPGERQPDGSIRLVELVEKGTPLLKPVRIKGRLRPPTGLRPRRLAEAAGGGTFGESALPG